MGWLSGMVKTAMQESGKLAALAEEKVLPKMKEGFDAAVVKGRELAQEAKNSYDVAKADIAQKRLANEGIKKAESQGAAEVGRDPKIGQ